MRLDFCETGMVGDFKAHDPRHGHRLEKQIGLGASGAFRQVREMRGTDDGPGDRGLFVGTPRSSPAPASVGGVMARRERVQSTSSAGRLQARAKAEGKNKGGRPGFGEPWKAEGISRASWFRRRKEGG
jgi:hypothetical protein